MTGEILLQRSIGDRATRAGERREHILEVSRQLFIARGFHGTGVAQIAAATGVKVGQIYRDFACKEDIIAAIVARDLGNFLSEAELDQAVANRDIAVIRRWIRNFVSIGEGIDGYRLMPEITAESARNARIARIQDEITDRVRRALRQALSACAPGDEHEPARARLIDLIMTLGGGLYQWMVTEAERGRDPGPLCERLAVILEREVDELCELTAPR